MYLKELHITNFRCFDNYTVKFAPGVTVLFGKNGSGKSTLIHAIHKALSFAFKKNKGNEKTISLAAGFKGLSPRGYNLKEDLVRDWNTGLPLPFIDIYAKADFFGKEVEWNMYASTSTFKLQESKFKEAYQLLSESIANKKIFPMFAYYSDSFPHVSNKKTELSSRHMSLRNLAYLGWDEETAYSDLWIKRFSQIWEQWFRADHTLDYYAENALKLHKRDYELGKLTDQEYNEQLTLSKARLENALKDKALYDGEVSAITNCLVKFTKGDPNFEVINLFVSVYKEVGLCLETRDRKNPPFEKLPAGYKRILYIALDIAYRSFILNGTTNGEGIVIIDEIDLHLHPELEQAVLRRFTETFPNIQFIVSTHSPLVLTDIETKSGKNVVLKMSLPAEEPEVWQNVHGIDYNQMLEENMGVSKRKPEIDELFKKAWGEVADKNIDAAKATLNEIEQNTPPDQTELVKLRAMISRIEMIGK